MEELTQAAFFSHVEIFQTPELKRALDQSTGHFVLLQVELPLIRHIVSQFRETGARWMYSAEPGKSGLMTH